MHGRKLLMGTASLLIGGITLVGMSSAAFAVVDPMITVSDPGTAGPFIQGSGFTHGGLVKVQEYEAGSSTPLHTFKWNATSKGKIAHFAFCEGTDQLQFKATDFVTGKSTAKTAPASYTCSP